MTKVIIRVIIVLIILLIFFMPVGASFIKSDELVSLKVNIGLLKIKILPKAEKSSRKKKEKKKNKNKATEEKGKNSFLPKIGLDDIKVFLRIVKRLFYRLWKAFKINKLHLFFRFGGAGEPFDAVNNCSRMNAAIGAILPLLHGIVSVNDEKIETGIDFEECNTTVYIDTKVHFALGRLLFLILAGVISAIIWFVRRKMADRKSEKHNLTDNE